MIAHHLNATQSPLGFTLGRRSLLLRTSIIMCTGIETALAAASLAVGAATAVTSFAQQSQVANNQSAYNTQAQASAEQSRVVQQNAITQRQTQETDKASQELMDNQIREEQAQSRALVSAGESGIQGNSIDSIAQDFYRQGNRIDSATIRNNTMAVAQLQNERAGIDAQARSRSNTPPVNYPSIVGLGLGIAGAGVDAYTRYSRYQRGDYYVPSSSGDALAHG